jgi:hypothetical protein
VPERPNGTVLKTVDPSRGPWVQIPPPPLSYAHLVADIEGVRHTYRISRRAARSRIVWSVGWFVLLACCAIFFADPNYPLGRAGAVAATLVIALALPAHLALRGTFEVTLDEDGTCEFRAPLRTRRMRVSQIRWIKGGGWDEDGPEGFVIGYDGGKVRVDGDHFDGLIRELIDLNPGIKLKGAISRLQCTT